MEYEAPRLRIHGSVEALTMQGTNGVNNGQDQGIGEGLPCKLRGANGLKEKGVSDLNQAANANEGLQACSL